MLFWVQNSAAFFGGSIERKDALSISSFRRGMKPTHIDGAGKQNMLELFSQ